MKLKFLETAFCVAFLHGFLLSPLWLRLFAIQNTSLSSIFTAGQQSEKSEERNQEEDYQNLHRKSGQNSHYFFYTFIHIVIWAF